MLARLQQGLEQLYRIETDAKVDDFLVSSQATRALGLARAPREQLLLAEEQGELSIGLCIDDDVLQTLSSGEPHHHIEQNLEPFLLAVEGVSHFVCVAWNAKHDRQISALELELQAEVDKYVTCLLTTQNSGSLRQRLFVEIALDPNLSAEERDRYTTANQAAYRYSGVLEARYVKTGKLAGIFAELRRFYRLSLGDKLLSQ